jgi:glucose-6-phosphate-specific signal transduction histidine kinase
MEAYGNSIPQITQAIAGMPVTQQEYLAQRLQELSTELRLQRQERERETERLIRIEERLAASLAREEIIATTVTNLKERVGKTEDRLAWWVSIVAAVAAIGGAILKWAIDWWRGQ